MDSPIEGASITAITLRAATNDDFKRIYSQLITDGRDPEWRERRNEHDGTLIGEVVTWLEGQARCQLLSALDMESHPALTPGAPKAGDRSRPL